MDHDLRLAALTNLVNDQSPEVEAKLLSELDRVEGVLNSSTEYDDLNAALQVLAILATRFSFRVLPMLTAFVRSAPQRKLTWSGEPIVESYRKYRSATQLIREAIDVPQAIRYVHVEALMDFLLDIWQSEDKDTSKKAGRALESLATFNLNLFYGDPPVGVRPQQRVVDYFSKMGDAHLLAHTSIALIMLQRMLSPTMEGHTWTYNALNISRDGVPSEGDVVVMRGAAIELLKRMFLLSPAVAHRELVLQAMGAATRRERPSSDARTSAMFESNVIEVLNFLRDQVPVQEMQMVQAIEHDGYWNYYHAASPLVMTAALEVRDAVGKLPEYQIFKDLIGFKGIHGVWEDLKRSQTPWDDRDKQRREASARYLDSIDAQTYDMWRTRILEFAKSRSDDLAMFPIFYDFLGSLSRRMPAMALELLRDHEVRVQPFVIALLNGLWSSDRAEDALALVRLWMADRTKLALIAKSLNVDEMPRFELLGEILDVADSVDDEEGAAAVIQSMGVAARQFALGRAEAKAIFLKGMRMAAKRHDARWVNVIWFNKDIREFVESLNAAERAEMLASMAWVKKIGYGAEEVLAAIGKIDPEAVLGYLMDRVRFDRNIEGRLVVVDEEDACFEAIPYSLHTLATVLSSLPGELLRAVRAEFTPDEAGMFPYYGGARLIKAAFPEFNEAVQAELLAFIKTENQTDIEFVIGVLRTFAGDVPILDISKEIIMLVPERSTAWDEVAAAIESTGVVSGEYGMLEAYQAKREQIAPWKVDENPRVRAFAVWLTDNLDQMIVSERQRADAGIELRKHRYGVSPDPT